jgi:hypothetical protein
LPSGLQKEACALLIASSDSCWPLWKCVFSDKYSVNFTALIFLASADNLFTKFEFGSKTRLEYFLERPVKAAIGIFLSEKTFGMLLISYSLALRLLWRTLLWDFTTDLFIT